jgi:uncharacterized protein (TIGR03083 family)
MALRPVEPVSVVPLFPRLHEELVALLRNLPAADWARPTACAAWNVHDIAAHLLDSEIRRLSLARDGHPMPAPSVAIAGYRELVGYLNELNATWVTAARRIGPRLLVEFLEVTGPQLAAYFASLDPAAAAPFPVAWAGDEVSPNWFDIAREYTERWLHQQQIRDAVGRPGLTERRWLFPVLDVFVRALPFTYRDVAAADGTAVAVVIEGEAGGRWSLVRREHRWELFAGEADRPAARVRMSADTAWRLFSRGLAPDAAAARVAVEGDARLGAVVRGALAVMA